MLAACGQGAGPAPGRRRVIASEHEAFFLWAGVTPPRWLGQAGSVYVLGGEVRRTPGTAFVPLRDVPAVEGPDLWFTVRVERLDWEERVFTRILSDMARWEAAGNRVAGLQIDFDAATRGLGGYADFLADLRQRLPERHRLSITGLMDWSVGADPEDLSRLEGVIDEIVVQTYQGTRTIAGYEDYLGALSRLPIPYRIALVENGDWREPESLRDDPRFLGYVIFLVNG